MKTHTTIFVGLDVHKDSTAVAVAEPGAQARFVGTIGSQLGELLKVLGKLGDAQASLTFRAVLQPAFGDISIAMIGLHTRLANHSGFTP